MILIAGVSIIIITLLLFAIYYLYSEKKDLEKEMDGMNRELYLLIDENKKMKKELKGKK